MALRSYFVHVLYQDISVVQPEVKVFTVLIADFIHKTFPPDLTRTYLVGEKVQGIL